MHAKTQIYRSILFEVLPRFRTVYHHMTSSPTPSICVDPEQWQVQCRINLKMDYCESYCAYGWKLDI